MKKFEELLKKGEAKLTAEKEVAQQLVNSRAKVMREFAMPIYEFIEFVNKNYKKYNYNDKMVDIFLFDKSDMDYSMDETFTIKVAKKWAKMCIKSNALNSRIDMYCDDNFTITATVGYSKKKSFETAEALLEHICYLIATENRLEKI